MTLFANKKFCFAGFGTGAFSLAVPSYVTEIAERSIQGALSSCMQVSLVGLAGLATPTSE